MSASEDPPAVLLAAMRDAIAAGSFVGVTCSGRSNDRLTGRPVRLQIGDRVQFTQRRAGATTTDNVTSADALERIAAELAGAANDGYHSFVVRTTTADLQAQFSRRGNWRLLRHRASRTEVDPSHDRTKRRLVDPAAPFLALTGLTDEHGRIKPSARSKFRQIERFVEILSHTIAGATGESFVAVDLGCGASTLTFAMDHHLRERFTSVRTIGVDTKSELLAERIHIVDALGGIGPEFIAATIAEAPLPDSHDDPPIDLVLALHACDTATDDALERAVRSRAAYILAAPCCQHDLQTQLDRNNAPAHHEILLRHGIVRERLGDLLTDTLRAEILRAHGYRTDVIEFVSAEHTAKNLMIRAVYTGQPDPDAADAAQRLAEAWGVEPALARRIGYR